MRDELPHRTRIRVVLASSAELPALVHDMRQEHLVYQTVPLRVRRQLAEVREGYFLGRWDHTEWSIGERIPEG